MYAFKITCWAGWDKTRNRNDGMAEGTEKRNGMGIKRRMGIKLTTILYKTRHSF